ncbi:MAG: 1-acyl-sn-glycerol-3-phosphate acyltransferase [Bacteroidales bacterium]|nr:1-acyl-sn-glycerol-3-phosphate acyltransferase [Bacteroidales bacterium]
MKQQLAQSILKLFGWKSFINVPHVPASVICVAPHTSNWDFIVGKLAYTSLGLTAHFMIKKEWFFFPFNLIFNSMGGIPVERSKKTRLVDQVVEMFHKDKDFNIAITPEGTRKRNDKWKMGFYYIALKAQVPIQLAYFDYKKKVMAIDKIIIPSGDEQKDMKEISDYYSTVSACHPEQFALPKNK